MILLHEDGNVRIRRDGRFLVASLRRPHRVLSTSMEGGGLREDCTHVVNHQSCEPSGDDAAMRRWKELGPIGSHREDCREAGTDPDRTALCGTAANMRCAALSRRAFEEVEVTVVATAGVEGNATRAGDPARWHETQGGSRLVEPVELSGTIVVLGFLSVPCTAGCLVKASSMLVEAKTAALWDLRVPSRQSNRLATGTGTDQFALCSPLAGEGEWERRFSGSHNKLGQILSEAVHEAVSRALTLQNGLVPELRRNLWTALGRLGLDAGLLLETAARELAPEGRALLAANLQPLAHDPQIAAAAYALAEVEELGRVGILGAEALQEARANQAALLAAATSIDPGGFASFRLALLGTSAPVGELAARALVMGFAAKWCRQLAGSAPLAIS